jgi:hypothetical protein
MYKSLPLEIIYHILSYNRNFVIKNGKLFTIKRLDMSKYNLEIALKVHILMYPLNDCIYGFYVKFKNRRYRIYYREKDEIEVIFETVSKYKDNYYVEWHSTYIE